MRHGNFESKQGEDQNEALHQVGSRAPGGGASWLVAEDRESAAVRLRPMIPKIREIAPLADYRLLVDFDEGRRVVYDVAEDMRVIPDFAELGKVPGLFESVHLDTSRTCVVWNDRIDLPSHAIYEYGKDSLARAV